MCAVALLASTALQGQGQWSRGLVRILIQSVAVPLIAALWTCQECIEKELRAVSWLVFAYYFGRPWTK
jgi:hypothetical protein